MELIPKIINVGKLIIHITFTGVYNSDFDAIDIEAANTVKINWVGKISFKFCNIFLIISPPFFITISNIN